MPSIHRIPKDKKLPAKSWRVRWWADGKTMGKTVQTEAEAKALKTSLEHTILSGTYIDPKAGKITFKSYAEDWRAIQVHRPKTAASVESNLRLHCYPRLGNRPIGAIRRSEIQALVKEMDETMEPSTIRTAYTWLSIVLKSAVTDLVIPESPCRDITLPDVPQRKIKPLETETVEAIIDAVPDRFRALIILGAGTGARISEAVAITRDRWDWAHRNLEIDRQLVGIEDGRPVFGKLKSKGDLARTVPLSDVVTQAWSIHVQRYGLGPDGLLFTTEGGRPLDRHTFARVWRKATVGLDIPLGDGFHQLRHFFASVLLGDGAPITLVQELLGHSSVTTTMIYSHLMPDAHTKARDAVDRALGSRVSDRVRTLDDGAL